MGHLLLTLACSAGGVAAPNLDFAAAHFSPDFVRLLQLLLGASEGGAFSWRHVAALTGERMMAEVDSLAVFNDHLVGGVQLGRGGLGLALGASCNAEAGAARSADGGCPPTGRRGVFKGGQGAGTTTGAVAKQPASMLEAVPLGLGRSSRHNPETHLPKHPTALSITCPGV